MRYVLWGLGIVGFCVFGWAAAINFHTREPVVFQLGGMAILSLVALGWMAEVLGKLDAIKDKLPRKLPPTE